MPEETFKAGDSVTWKHSQGESIVKSDQTGALAAHKPSGLRRR